MGSICTSQPGVSSLFSGVIVSGIIFNDSDLEVEYDICGTKSKTLSQKVTKDANASVQVSVGPLAAFGGEAAIGAKQNVTRQVQQEDTIGQVFIKPHHYSTQGLVNLDLSQPIFFSISYKDKDGEQENFQMNIPVTCRGSICFLITRDLGCQNLDDAQVQYYKAEFDKDFDLRKGYNKDRHCTPELPEQKVQKAHVKELTQAQHDLQSKKLVKSSAPKPS